MQSQHHMNSSIEDLPRDILSVIISKVAADSREDLASCLLASAELAATASDSKVFKSMNLDDIAASPLLALTRYTQLMAKCLAHSNPTAHYITGILKYFHLNDPLQGMFHFHAAAHADVPIGEAVYLYGVIKLCTGEYELGKSYLDTLGSHTDDSVSKQCWKSIKRSLHGIGNAEKPEYVLSLLEMMPPFECNVYDMKNSCPMCYHYKKMYRFIHTM